MVLRDDLQGVKYGRRRSPAADMPTLLRICLAKQTYYRRAVSLGGDVSEVAIIFTKYYALASGYGMDIGLGPWEGRLPVLKPECACVRLVVAFILMTLDD